MSEGCDAAGPGPPGLWVGIDEAGYGPNLGPLVMTAVVAGGGRPPPLGAALAATVCRAGEPGDRLWVDDSKLVFAGRKGRPRLDAACLAAVMASRSAKPATLGALVEAVGAGPLEAVELHHWVESDPPL